MTATISSSRWAPSQLYSGAGSCYIEFGGERVGCVDVDFLFRAEANRHVL